MKNIVRFTLDGKECYFTCENNHPISKGLKDLIQLNKMRALTEEKKELLRRTICELIR